MKVKILRDKVKLFHAFLTDNLYNIDNDYGANILYSDVIPKIFSDLEEFDQFLKWHSNRKFQDYSIRTYDLKKNHVWVYFD